MWVRSCLFLSLICFIGAINASIDEEFDPAENRPCPTLELECIREYFSKHSQCEKATEPAADSLIIEKYTINIYNYNVSVDVIYTKFVGLRQLQINEFYYNSVTRSLVFGVKTSYVKIDRLEAIFRYNERASGPIPRNDSFICDFIFELDYDLLKLTADFPNHDDLRLKDAIIFTFAKNPQYNITRRFQKTPVPETEAEFDEMLLNIDTAIRNLLSSQGSVLMKYYVQQNICNFGEEIDTE